MTASVLPVDPSAATWDDVRQRRVVGPTVVLPETPPEPSSEPTETPRPPGPRVAVVHDFLYTYAGAERVLEQILAEFPDADLFSLFDFLRPQDRHFIAGRKVRTSFIQRLPLAKRFHRHYLPLMPIAVEQLDVGDYDIVISSSYLAAKGVITRPDQLHVCYCHTPIRFAWDLQHQYLAESGLLSGGVVRRLKGLFARVILHYVRNWDQRSSNGVDVFVTNSRYVARRIRKIYRRDSVPIYPPVDLDEFALCRDTPRGEFYLTASRQVPYKRIDLIVEAFARMPDRRLVVIGDGPQHKRLAAMAGPNVTMLGFQEHDVLLDHMKRARAFVFAAEEDFGIVPVEAQACGTPVIAFGRGGATETVIDGRTGVLFAKQTPECLVEAVRRFEQLEAAGDIRRDNVRTNAERFSTGRFRQEFGDLVRREWKLSEAFLARPTA